MFITVWLLFLLHLISFNLADIRPNNRLFDYDLYEDVLDPELCNTQLDYLANNNMAMLPCKYLLVVSIQQTSKQDDRNPPTYNVNILKISNHFYVLSQTQA